MKPLEQNAMPDATDKDTILDYWSSAQRKKIVLLNGIIYPGVSEILKNLST